MDKQHLKKISDGLLKTFIDAGEKSIKLREIGLKKEIKPDNTPVTNGDIEVNNILTKKIKISLPIYRLFQKKVLRINQILK